MATSSPKKHQLVLFDGDDNRTKLFDQIEQLSKIPSWCEFYIFTNENDPILEKILDNLTKVSQVRVRRSAKSISEQLLNCLEEYVDQYCHVLIVCGPNPSYKPIFQSLWNKYGFSKMYVMNINQIHDMTVQAILAKILEHSSTANHQSLVVNKCQQSPLIAIQEKQKSCNTEDKISLLNTNIYIGVKSEISPKTNNQASLVVQPLYRCQHCNEEFQSRTAQKKHFETQASCDMSNYS